MDMIEALRARLPELSWQLQKIGEAFPWKALPYALFPRDCRDPVASIEADLARIVHMSSDSLKAHYLAEKIQHKVHVLVSICISFEKGEEQPPIFDLSSLMTRQQWLVTLRTRADELKVQRDALGVRIAGAKSQDRHLVQAMRGTLGQLEKALTLAEEAYGRAR